MPKPFGTIGATKMKIMAIICHNLESGNDAYGYSIWQNLKDSFYIYMNENDIRNVYHHLNDLCELNYIVRNKTDDIDPKCYYQITEQGKEIRQRYDKFLEILQK